MKIDQNNNMYGNHEIPDNMCGNHEISDAAQSGCPPEWVEAQDTQGNSLELNPVAEENGYRCPEYLPGQQLPAEYNDATNVMLDPEAMGIFPPHIWNPLNGAVIPHQAFTIHWTMTPGAFVSIQLHDVMTNNVIVSQFLTTFDQTWFHVPQNLIAPGRSYGITVITMASGHILSTRSYFTVANQLARISLNANGGFVNPTVVDRTIGSQVGLLPIPTRPNFTYQGWWSSPSGLGVRMQPHDYIWGNATVFARWSNPTGGNRVTVTFNPTQGFLPVNLRTKTVDIGHPIRELPEPTPPNAFTFFNGWWTTPQHGGWRFDENEPFLSNITLYARWATTPAPVIRNPSNGAIIGHHDHVARWDLIPHATYTFGMRNLTTNTVVIDNAFVRAGVTEFPIRQDQLRVGDSYRIAVSATLVGAGNSVGTSWSEIVFRVGRVVNVPASISGTITRVNGAVENFVLNSRGDNDVQQLPGMRRSRWFAFYGPGLAELPLIDAASGRIRICVGPRILDPNYPDTGRVQADDFSLPIDVDVILRHRSTGHQRTLHCIVMRGGVKAHSFNHYPHPQHPRNHLFRNEQVMFPGIQSGMHQTGIAYPLSWNSRDESQWSEGHMDGSTVEFRESRTIVENALGINLSHYDLHQVIVFIPN